MELMDYILEKENKFLVEIKELKRERNPIYIYGAAQGAKQVAERLSQQNITYDGMVVDAEYWNKQSGVLCLENVLAETKEEISLIIAFKGFKSENQIPYQEKIKHIVNRDCWGGNYEVDNTYHMIG